MKNIESDTKKTSWVHVRAALHDSAAAERVAYHAFDHLLTLAFLLIFRLLLHNAESKGGITLLRGQIRRRGLSPKVTGLCAKVGGHRLLNLGALLTFVCHSLLTIDHEHLQTFTRKHQIFIFQPEERKTESNKKKKHGRMSGRAALQDSTASESAAYHPGAHLPILAILVILSSFLHMQRARDAPHLCEAEIYTLNPKP